MELFELKACHHGHWLFHLDHGTVLVQPAGPVGQRHVFVAICFNTGDDPIRTLELVLSEQVASRLGQALASGSVGLMQEFNLSVDGCD
jgi:hypothetical protein